MQKNASRCLVITASRKKGRTEATISSCTCRKLNSTSSKVHPPSSRRSFQPPQLTTNVRRKKKRSRRENREEEEGVEEWAEINVLLSIWPRPARRLHRLRGRKGSASQCRGKQSGSLRKLIPTTLSSLIERMEYRSLKADYAPFFVRFCQTLRQQRWYM